MKKVFIIFIALLFSASAFAQEDFPRNELRVNVFPSLVFLFPEITYERILNENFSIGVSAGLSTLPEPVFRDFSIIPFCRFYLDENLARGFFAEINAAFFASGSGPVAGDPSHPFSRFGYANLGVGFGLGWKTITRNDWVWDFMIGGGRAFGGGVYSRFGITLGRRF